MEGTYPSVFVGPPGTGEDVHRGCLLLVRIGRKFVRISLGGIRDEAEIRGHRRTYIGLSPDASRGLRKVGPNNPGIHAR